MPTLSCLRSLLTEDLRALYYAERQWVAFFPRLIKSAKHADLKAALFHHLRETRGHVDRLSQALKLLGSKPKGKTSAAALGLVTEGSHAIVARGPAPIRDANLIGAAQAIEHYEIAAYGTAYAFAAALYEVEIMALLDATLHEERVADKRLSQIGAEVIQAALSIESSRFVSAA